MDCQDYCHHCLLNLENEDVIESPINNKVNIDQSFIVEFQ